MKIAILGLNYLPESTSIGPYTADLAEYLQKEGHDVRVVTGFPSAPNWKIWPGYQGKGFMREVVNGVPILRTYLYIPGKPRKALNRILFDTSFAISALAGLFAGPRPDLVVVISPPLQLAITGWLMALFSRCRYCLHIQDLVPDAAASVGALRRGSLAWKLGEALEQWAYRRATAISVICEGMRTNLLQKGVPAEKVLTLPDYIDPKFIQPAGEQSQQFRSKFGIAADAFLVMYSGSVSGKQGLQTYIEAAALCESEPGISCCLIGAGANLDELKILAEKLSLKRFLFLDLQPRESLPAQLSAADVLIVTQRKLVTDIAFPGKLLYYMAAGTAILAAANEQSETARFIQEHQVGIVVPPEDPEALAKALVWMRQHPERTRELGRNGRHMAQTEFNRSLVLAKFGSYLEQLRPARVSKAGARPSQGRVSL